MSCPEDCDRPCDKKNVNVIYVPNKLNCDHLFGTFLDDSHYDTMITEDTDVYGPSIDGSMTEYNIVAKFRKNVFTPEEHDLCYEGLINAASESQNRGMAAGPRGDMLAATGRGGREWVTPYQIDILEFLTRTSNSLLDDDSLESIKKKHERKQTDITRGHVWLRSEVCNEWDPYFGWFDRWVESLDNKTDKQRKAEALHIKNDFISETNYAQTVMSGVAGYYSRYPRIPYGRATSFTEKNPDSFEKSFKYLQKLDHCFRELLPERWAAQRAAADRLDPNFVISNTVFTTLTVNHNFRTAAHLDAGDLASGFSNLSALGKGWGGAELVLPEYRAAVKLAPNDLLLVANHTAMHGNLPLTGKKNDRMTIVAYFREDMLECGSWEYEQLRKQYVDERRLNKNHPEWRKLWNGVSAGMWDQKEWFEYMRKAGMEDPYGKESVGSLEDFF